MANVKISIYTSTSTAGKLINFMNNFKYEYSRIEVMNLSIYITHLWKINIIKIIIL